MTINTGSHVPIRLKPYRAPLNQRKITDKTMEELLAANIIRTSRTGWAAPIIIVKKKNNTPRMCVDNRALNKITKVISLKKNTKDISLPLPLIDDLLALVSKAKWFTSMDVKSGYYQIKVRECDKEKNVIRMS